MLTQKTDNRDDEDTTGPSRPWTIEERLDAFYCKYQPDKVDGVPALLEKYVGKEEKLFTALVKKYGPEPEDPYVAAATDNGAEDKMENLNISDKKKRRGVGAKKTSKVSFIFCALHAYLKCGVISLCFALIASIHHVFLLAFLRLTRAS